MINILSNPIEVTLNTSTPMSYIDYQVFKIYNNTRELIYTGSAFAVSNSVKIILNDIVSNFYPTNSVDNLSPNLFDFEIVTSTEVKTVNNIAGYISDPNLRYLNPGTDLVNPLYMRLPVIPHIPINTDFRFMCYNEAGLDGYTVNYLDKYNRTYRTEEFENTEPVIIDLINAPTGGSVNINGDTIAIVDECPAKCYLQWIDRTGSVQSQRLDGNVVYNENITNSVLTTYRDVQKVFSSNIQSYYAINTGWIDFDTRKVFESVLVSPSIELLFTNSGISYKVICKNSSFTEERKNKLYNLSIDLYLDTEQKIRY